MSAKSKNLFVIGDVHGCNQELKTLIRKLPLNQDSSLLFLGDYVDRGPDSKGVIDTLLDLAEFYEVIALKGNHEWLLTEFLKKPEDPVAAGNFILNGGSATLASYSADGESFDVPSSHREFLGNLKLYHMTDTHFFVHAGIPPDFDFSLNKIDDKMTHQLLWIRKGFLDSKRKWARRVVHGHTPVRAPEILPNRINLDTGCVFGRSLTAMNMANGQLLSVERHQGERPTFLSQTLQGGRARARRFAGEVAVDLLVGGQLFPFRTVNFNEFGVLIFAANEAKPLVLQMGQVVEGKLKPGGDEQFRFRGSVVRIETSQSQPLYAIKFDLLDASEEQT